MAELIGCSECDSPSCKGCNIKILADMLNHGRLDALMNKNRRIDGSVDAMPVVHSEWEITEVDHAYGKNATIARSVARTNGDMMALDTAQTAGRI